ncbi:hypothetical protein K2X89_07845 [Myxococcota bacterium]|nr:hypothetical protein [Myxococcota bacterium]
MASLWGFLGAAVWWAVRVFAQLEIGFIAIAIGYFVGKAVFSASGHRGGTGYQVLAVALTYFWICANYVPDIVSGLMNPVQAEETDDPSAHASDSASEDLAAEAPLGDSPDAESAQSELEPANAAQSPSPTDEPPPGNLGIAIVAIGAIVFGLALSAPFFDLANNLIGLLIIFFGLWQAWSSNQRANVAVAGPFAVGVAGSASASG